MRPTPTNVSKVVDWPIPKTAKQIKQFVAMGSYYRRYIKNFASIVRPMVELTKKGKRFLWNEACQEAFETLKKELIGADVMGYPMNEAGTFTLDVDASDIGIGGILHQIQDGRERVIAYASRSLNKAEKNYCITEKELLAVRFFVEYFCQYLLGRRFVVRTDHQALVWLFKLKEPSGKVARWIEILSQYDFAIEYRPGHKQAHCDALSRCENPHDCDCPNQDTDEPLKYGPCKKCLKRAQDMALETSSCLSKDAIILQEKQPKVGDSEAGQSEDLRAIQEMSEPGTSLQDALQQTEKKSVNVSTYWAGTRSTEELCKLQRDDPDIGPLLTAKISGSKPSSQDMVTLSPASRH